MGGRILTGNNTRSHLLTSSGIDPSKVKPTSADGKESSIRTISGEIGAFGQRISSSAGRVEIPVIPTRGSKR